MIKAKSGSSWYDIDSVVTNTEHPVSKIWSTAANAYVWEKTITYVSSIPVIFNSDGTVLINYRIYGESVQDGTPAPDNPVEVTGLGARTENLLNDVESEQGYGYISNTLLTDTIPKTVNWAFTTEYIPVKSNTMYGFFSDLFRSSYTKYNVVVFYDSDFNYISHIALNNKSSFTPGNYDTSRFDFVSTPSDCAYLRVSIDRNSTMNLIIEGSTAPTSYIPYGYKLPMVVTNGTTTTTTPIYIGSNPLAEDEYVDFGEQKIYRMVNGILTPTDPPVPLPQIPTFEDTETVIDYEEEVKPSYVEVEARVWDGEDLIFETADEKVFESSDGIPLTV